MISLSDIVRIVEALAAVGIVCFLLDLLVQKCPWLSPEWKAGIRYVILALGILVLIGLVIAYFGPSGGGPIFRQ